MFTTENLPEYLRPDPTKPHECGHPACGFDPQPPAPAPGEGVPSER